MCCNCPKDRHTMTKTYPVHMALLLALVHKNILVIRLRQAKLNLKLTYYVDHCHPFEELELEECP